MEGYLGVQSGKHPNFSDKYMWDVLFVISFVINIALLIYFLKPETIVVPEDPEPEEVTGYTDDDAFMGFPIKGKSYDYTKFFTGKDPRYQFGLE